MSVLKTPIPLANNPNFMIEVNKIFSRAFSAATSYLRKVVTPSFFRGIKLDSTQLSRKLSTELFKISLIGTSLDSIPLEPKYHESRKKSILDYQQKEKNEVKQTGTKLLYIN